MIYLIAVLFGLAVGCLFGVQPSINGSLASAVEHPLQASLISFGTGASLMLAICAFSGNFPLRFSVSPSGLPWWIWVGGPIGVVVVTGSLLLVPRIGALSWFAALITGQVITATMLDHFGWLGTPRVQASPLRLLGAVVLLAGLALIVAAKLSDTPSARLNLPERSAEQDGIGKNHG